MGVSSGLDIDMAMSREVLKLKNDDKMT
jgi:hypothetical protein